MPDNEKDNKEKSLAFSKIYYTEDLIKYLDSGSRLKDVKFLYHYTTLGTAVKIFNSRKWYLGLAKDMNDLLEYKNGDDKRWEHLFFASFMGEDRESMGMWSMYAQPWQRGVKIEIPKDSIRALLKETNEVLLLNRNENPNEIMPIKLSGDDRIWISRVAYSNQDNKEDIEDETLFCGYEKNIELKNAAHSAELTGYIKDSAWSYEKEFRIKASIKNSYEFDTAAIKLTDEFLDSLRIISSPLFKGNLKNEFEKEIKRQCNTGQSFFTNKMNYKSPCDDCELENKMSKLRTR